MEREKWAWREEEAKERRRKKGKRDWEKWQGK